MVHAREKAGVSVVEEVLDTGVETFPELML
jgi:hypothetical protein